MARKVTPNSWADTTAYIAESSDASAEAVSVGGGQPVNTLLLTPPRGWTAEEISGMRQWHGEAIGSKVADERPKRRLRRTTWRGSFERSGPWQGMLTGLLPIRRGRRVPRAAAALLALQPAL